jgi:hypothetical protein
MVLSARFGFGSVVKGIAGNVSSRLGSVWLGSQGTVR